MDKNNYPVHESLTVQQGTDIYRTEEWHKAVVQYQFESNEGRLKTAVYLWHKEADGWKRKNKYMIKSREAWADDLPVIDRMLDTLEEPTSNSSAGEQPVSEYYSVKCAQTIFKSDKWWKSIVHINQKGEYETDEIIIYLWQRNDGEWLRRQKYAIKDADDWKNEKKVISEFVGEPVEDSTNPTTQGEGMLADIESEFEPQREANHVSRVTNNH